MDHPCIRRSAHAGWVLTASPNARPTDGLHASPTAGWSAPSRSSAWVGARNDEGLPELLSHVDSPLTCTGRKAARVWRPSTAIMRAALALCSGSLSAAARHGGQPDDHRAGETSDRELRWSAGCG